jgi:hypothetical protein
MNISILQPEDVDVAFLPPEGLVRVVEQNLVNLAPWHIMGRDLARKRLRSLRERYRTSYVPFAFRQDNDDLAVLVPETPGRVLTIHDFSAEGAELISEYSTFWDWFRAAVEEMIQFE